VRCDENFDSFFASHFALFTLFAFSHFFRIFLALFASFWFNNREKTTKKVEKVRKCEEEKKREVRCECECYAKAVQSQKVVLTKSVNANAMRQRFRTTIPGSSEEMADSKLAAQVRLTTMSGHPWSKLFLDLSSYGVTLVRILHSPYKKLLYSIRVECVY
jgi:hypothetical protein